MTSRALQMIDTLVSTIDAVEQKTESGCPYDSKICPNVAGKVSAKQYAEMVADITALLKEKKCAPILVRLAWHDSGTYCKASKSGGPRAAQRFGAGESKHGGNAGLEIARNLLKPLVLKYCASNTVSIADLWTLAGNVAIKATGGPDVPFRFGRKDIKNATQCVEEGRLPDAKQGVEHVRCVLGRIGFSDDKDVVALSGAHTLGSCHADRSGFEGPWTTDPLKFDNSYFKDLLNKKWKIGVSSAGNTQFVNNDSGATTMMLPTDFTLVNTPETRVWVEKYAKDEKLFFKDFAVAWQKLIESGYDDKTLYSVQ
eukprot:CAMPEP_0202687946 /NCGR_PEP_ID=MMETSP1385-20130828/3493_1 /ASSEMBLY_ACC=CAM_ASM_000861 /TAXON_ID=933848 /ORGANISM="Elphidium margaritaceum" /LENGTH=311 /DNA_ID=CAMNT_0049342811 /DNA_START=56 /DNA_END=991 /DNA_ORIENTATION=+